MIGLNPIAVLEFNHYTNNKKNESMQCFKTGEKYVV